MRQKNKKTKILSLSLFTCCKTSGTSPHSELNYPPISLSFVCVLHDLSLTFTFHALSITCRGRRNLFVSGFDLNKFIQGRSSSLSAYYREEGAWLNAMTRNALSQRFWKTVFWVYKHEFQSGLFDYYKLFLFSFMFFLFFLSFSRYIRIVFIGGTQQTDARRANM